MIYFVQAIDGGPIKIGTTTNLERRLVGLKSTEGQDHIVLAVMDGGREEEQTLHERFSHLRVKPFKACEWFLEADELLAFVDEEARPWNGEVEKEAASPDVLLVYKADKTLAPTFKAWLEALAEHVGAPLTVTVDMALKRYAEGEGFKTPMPKRLAR